jgi:hypothetical protein
MTWTQLPEPPSAGGLEFRTLQDGWLVVGASGEELDVTHDGGKTWQQVSLLPPDNCKQCEPDYDVPRFQNANNGTMTAILTDSSSAKWRRVHVTYVTHDGGKTWQNTEAFEPPDLYSEIGIASQTANGVTWIFQSRSRDQIQIRRGSSIINSPYPAGLPPQGAISYGRFVDDLNGCLVHSTSICGKDRNYTTDGPGPDCLVPIVRSDLLATTDGGKTFKVITPILPPLSIP